MSIDFNLFLYFVLNISITLINVFECTPVNYSHNARTRSPAPTPPEIIDYMRKFGYLDKTTSTSEALYHEDAIISAIKNVQKYGALNETGVLDNETLKLLTTPRCGVADIPPKMRRKKRYVIGAYGWRKRHITYFIANWSPKIGEAKVVEGMRRAFDAWAIYGNIKFERVFHAGADIIIAFGNGYHGDYFPFDGPGNILAHAFYPYEMRAFGGDIHFDNDENWLENATSLSEGVDFVSVAVHELGHSLGLAHSPVYTSIMFPYYKGPADATTLKYDDIMAMYELYIKNRPYEDEYVSRGYQETSSTYFPRYATSVPRTVPTTTEAPSDYDEADSSEDEEYEYSPESSDTADGQTTFHGDFETVDKHKRRFGFTVSSINPSTRFHTLAPGLCLDNHFDCLAVLRGEILLFKKGYVWKLTEDFRPMTGYPIRLRQMFPELPDTVTHIDAAYERHSDRAIVLFIGNQYWIYNETDFTSESARPISDFGFDSKVQKIDAVMVWSKNKKTYLFSGNIFSRFDEDRSEMDRYYPAEISRKWRGIPNGVDAAVDLPNGKTYFFKDGLYWFYNNYWIRPQRGYPKRTRNLWC